MKKCPVCGQIYDDIYTKCHDGGNLLPTTDSAPSKPAVAAAYVPPKAESPPQPPSRSAGLSQAKPPQIPGSSKGPAALVRILVIIALFLGLLEWMKSIGQQVGEHREQAAQLKRTSVQVQGEVRQMLKATNVADALAGAQDMGQMFDTAAAGSSGQAKAVMEALARFTKKSASVMANLPVADGLMKQGMDMTDVGTLEQCQAKKALVLQACDMIDQAAAYEKNSLENMRNELQHAQLPPDVIAKMLTAEQTSANLLRRDGSTLLEYSQSRKDMADLLVSGWGKWTFDKDEKKFTFTDESFSADYKASLKAGKAADAARVAVGAAVRLAAQKSANQP
jgi:hypothetical protein